MSDIQSIARVAPLAFSFSQPFWEGTREKKILVQHCLQTGKAQFYPRPISIFTGRRGLEWREVSGQGKIYSYTIARRGPPAFHGTEPFIIVSVELDCGVVILSNLVNCDLDEVAIDRRVTPVWVPSSEGKHQLMFELDRQS